MRERQGVERPLPLLRPASPVVELDDVRPMRDCNFTGCVRAVRIDDVHLSEIPQGVEASRQITGLVAGGDDYAHRQQTGSSIYPLALSLSRFFGLDHS